MPIRQPALADPPAKPAQSASQDATTVPTGVPILDIRDRLIAAAERVLLRDGPSALTSRAVTTEAGVAKGILHRCFPDFETFLGALVLTRIERLDALSRDLRTSAGAGALIDNLAGALAASLDPLTIRVVNLVWSRDELLDRLRLTTPVGIPILAETTKMIAAYLTAERGLGRMPIDTDVDALALVLVGAAHLHAASRAGTPTDPDALRDVVAIPIARALKEPRQRRLRST